MWSLGEFTRQVLPWKVQLLMQISPPFGAIGHIINDAPVGNEFPCPALACAPFQFQLCDDTFRRVHAQNYTGWRRAEDLSFVFSAIFLTTVRLHVVAGSFRVS